MTEPGGSESERNDPPPSYPAPDAGLGSAAPSPPPPGQSYPPQPYGQPYPPQPYYGAVAGRAPGHAMYVAAAIINWVVLALIVVATLGFGIILAAWYVPMTIRMHKDANDHAKHTALGVCTLLFCNLISGILILVADSNRQSTPSLQ